MNWIKEPCYIGNHEHCGRVKWTSPCFCECHSSLLFGEGEPFNPNNDAHLNAFEKYIKKLSKLLK